MHALLETSADTTGSAFYIVLVNSIPDDNRADDVMVEGIFDDFQKAIDAAFKWAESEGYEADGNTYELTAGHWYYLEDAHNGARIAFLVEDFLLNVSTTELEAAVNMPTQGTA